MPAGIIRTALGTERKPAPSEDLRLRRRFSQVEGEAIRDLQCACVSPDRIHRPDRPARGGRATHRDGLAIRREGTSTTAGGRYSTRAPEARTKGAQVSTSSAT
jgi:hypothetical protein